MVLPDLPEFEIILTRAVSVLGQIKILFSSRGMDGTRFIFDMRSSLFMSGTSGIMSRLDEVCKGTVSIEKSGLPWMKIFSFRI